MFLNAYCMLGVLLACLDEKIWALLSRSPLPDGGTDMQTNDYSSVLEAGI